MKESPEESAAPARPWMRWVHVLVSLVGLALAVAVPVRLGMGQVLDAVRPALAVLPLCFGCELLRVCCEAGATRLALGRKVPWGPMTLAHLASYAVSTVFPAPRPAAEAVKTTILGEHVGVPEAASAGGTLQAATFFSVGAVCGLAGFTCLGTRLSLALFVNSGLLLAMGLLLRGLMRSTRLTAFLGRRWPKRRAALERLHTASLQGHIFAFGPTACLVLSLSVRVFEQYFIIRAMGAKPSVAGALTAEGVRLLGASFGVLVPGQMGVREAVFALSAEALHTTEAAATANALFTHLVELSLALVGFVALAVWRLGRRR